MFISIVVKTLSKIPKLTLMVRVLRCTHPNAICILTAPDSRKKGEKPHNFLKLNHPASKGCCVNPDIMESFYAILGRFVLLIEVFLTLRHAKHAYSDINSFFVAHILYRC